MENIPIDAEYLDINNFFKVNSPELWMPHYATQTTCSYLVKKSTCEKLLSTIVPFNLVIDHRLNAQMQLHNMKTYWSNHPLIHHRTLNMYSGSYIRM